MGADFSQCVVNVSYGSDANGGLPVALGVPFAAGALRGDDGLLVTSPAGHQCQAALQPLATWPDGSVRWGLVSFGARAAGAHGLRIGRLSGAAAGSGITLAQQGTQWVVKSDRLSFTVCSEGSGIFGEISCDGKPLLDSPSGLAFCVDGASTRHEAKRMVEVVEASPWRVRLQVSGRHCTAGGAATLAYRLGIEAWAGWPSLRLDYHYFNLLPGQAAFKVKRIAMESAWQLGEKTARHFQQKNYGLFYLSRHVYNPAMVAIASTLDRESAFVEDPAMLLDDVDYPFYLAPPLVDTASWLGVCGAEQSVYLKISDFCEARPNRMVSSGAVLDGEVWPATAETLELPQGRSRRQSFYLAFAGVQKESGVVKESHAPVQAAQGVAALLDALQHEGRAAVAPQWLAQCRAFGAHTALPAGRHFRIEQNLQQLVQLDMPVTKFDVGDTSSHYNSSYATINTGKVLPLPGAPHVPRLFPTSSPTATYLDLHEPVWTNNEYDVIHAFAAELMRTGRHELWETLRLAARHNIEVDFLHYSDHKWLHRATPAHSARHTTTGAYPSHFWTQGLLEYYCLSGDRDALEVALALGDKTLQNFSDPELRPVLWGFNREIGWAVLLLAALVDVTGEARFRPLLDEMVAYLVGFDRHAFRGGVNLSRGNDRQSLNRQIVANFFGYASMIEGIDLYAAITGSSDTAQWLGTFCLELADEALNAAREGEMCGINFCTALAIGYERTGDRRFMQLAGILLDTVYWNGNGPRGGSVKPVAMSYRNFPRFLGHAWKHGLLAEYEYPHARALSGGGTGG